MTNRRRNTEQFHVTIIALVTILWVSTAAIDAGELFIGAADVSITPSEPVALLGQVHTRIAREAESPLTATALAIETRDGDKVLDQAITVSCDLAGVPNDLQDLVRERIEKRLPGFDLNKLFLAATHTHTAPVTREGVYIIPKKGVMQPTEYVEFLAKRLEDAVVRAWENRRAGGVSWGLGHALVAHNRRAVYANGKARMYGATHGSSFRGIEGYEDHYVDVLFFFNADRKVTAVAVNIPCPAQEVEGRSALNADFWHEVRLLLRKRFGKDLQVIAWTGAAGDQSPHLMWYKRAEERMRKLRGRTRLEEIAHRIDAAVGEAYQGAKQDIRFDAPLTHHVKSIQLPVRMVTEQEFKKAKAFCDAVAKKDNPDARQSLNLWWNQNTVERYEKQKTNPHYTMELHSLRLGDIAVCTNPFELYTEFGIRIRARSKAVQTFVVQLACASGGYVPTKEAIRGGSYSTDVFSNLVGPEGGDSLVDQTVKAINALWD